MGAIVQDKHSDLLRGELHADADILSLYHSICAGRGKWSITRKGKPIKNGRAQWLKKTYREARVFVKQHPYRSVDGVRYDIIGVTTCA